MPKIKCPVCGKVFNSVSLEYDEIFDGDYILVTFHCDCGCAVEIEIPIKIKYPNR